MQELEKEGLSQILITDPVAIFYLTGRWIHPGERFLGLYLGKDRESVLFINTSFNVLKKSAFARSTTAIRIISIPCLLKL